LDFGLSEEQQMLQETVRSLLEDACPPNRLREIFEAGDGHDAALWDALAEIGLTGLLVPEAFGGAGLEVLDLALAMEVVGSAALPGPFLGHSLACAALCAGGTDDQKRAWLPGLAEGRVIGTVALCEEGDVWQPEGWTTQCKSESLQGSKVFVPNANVANLVVVGCAGGEVALVDLTAESPEVRSQDGIDRTRPIYRLDFDGVPCQPLADGGAALERMRDIGHVMLAADAFGAATRLIDISVEYAKTREQFGQAIGQFQAVKHQLARLGTDVEPTRALFWYAAHAVDHLADEAERAAAMAKAHITERAVEAGRVAVELHGGLGFTWQCDVHMWLKRAMFDRAFLVSPERLRERCADLAGW
jgi:alkylation response protein AidB-like acyl-CoA dehydrogenase